MFFKSKPLLYLQVLDRSIRYLTVDSTDKSILDKGEVILETNILEDGEMKNDLILETRLDALVKEKQWQGAKTHLLLLNHFVVLREEMIPVQLRREEIREYLSLHIGQSIRIPYQYPRFDFQIIEKEEEEQRIFIIAYPGKNVDTVQRLLNRVGLKPAVADIIPLGHYRIAEKQGLITRDIDQHTLIIEWNPYELAFMVFNQDRPTFFRQSRSIALSESWNQNKEGQWIWKHSADELMQSLDDQINSLERFLDFYSYSVLDGEAAVTDIVLTGYYPDLEYLQKLLSKRFTTDVQLLDLPEELDNKYAALYGLVLKRDTDIVRRKSKQVEGGRSK